MPKYSYTCSCGHVFDELHTSFGAAEHAEKEGIKCPKCESVKTERTDNPTVAMAGSGFRKYGLYTYK